MRRSIATALILAGLSSAASAGILSKLFPKPKAQLLDPAAYAGLTHLIVVDGRTGYQGPQDILIARLEDRLRDAACWQVMGHAESRAKIKHAPLPSPSPGSWSDDAQITSELLSRLPRRDARLGVLVVWVREWRGSVYARRNIEEATDKWLGDRLKARGTPAPTRGEYERDAVAQVFDSETGAQIWRGHMFFGSGTPLGADGRLPYADEEARDEQVSREYDDFASFFGENLRHPPSAAECRPRPTPETATKPAAADVALPAPNAQAIAGLTSADPAARAEAARKLGEPDDEDGVAPLIKALADPDLKVRATAADSLGRIGSPKAADALAGALSDPSKLLRAVAARSLGRIGSDKAKPALQKLLAGEKEKVVRDEAEAALRKIDDPANMKMDVDALMPPEKR